MKHELERKDEELKKIDEITKKMKEIMQKDPDLSTQAPEALKLMTELICLREKSEQAQSTSKKVE